MMKCIQINLHKSKAASYALQNKVSNFNVVFIQEPWAHENKIKGLAVKGKRLIYCGGENRARAALMLDHSISATPLTEFLTRDLAAAVIEVKTHMGNKRTVIASSYFPYEEKKPPPQEVELLVKFCKKKGMQLVMGCDANSHHAIWGSSDTRSRGEFLLDFMTKNDLSIANRGSKPTYRHEGLDREEVIDLTLTSLDMESLIMNWHVSSEPSLSDHRYIEFDIDSPVPKSEEYRDPRRTNWSRYTDELRDKLAEIDMEIQSVLDLEDYSKRIKMAVISSYEISCPIRRTATKRCRWWSKKLETMKINVRKLYKKRRSEEGRREYSKALTEYNSEIRKSKRADFLRFTEEIDDLPAAARLRRTLGKDHTNGIGMLRKSDGKRTEDQREATEVLMSTHFPKSTPSENNDFYFAEKPVRRRNRRLFLKSKKII